MSVKTKFPQIKPTLNLDFANTKRLDPRITFTRASTATYYDGKTFAKAEENLFRYSNDFSNAAWVKQNATLTPNAVTLPDGTVGTRVQFPSVSANQASIYQLASANVGGLTGTLSVKLWVASGTATVKLKNTHNGILDYYQTVTITTTPTVYVFSQAFSANNERAAGGVVNEANTAADFYMAQAQYEISATASPYIETTALPISNVIPVLQTAGINVGRIDHNPVTTECLGLLIEEQRVNSALYSTLDTFGNLTNASRESSMAVSPDGTKSAVRLKSTSGYGNHGYHQAITVTNTTVYTASIFAKAGTSNYLHLSGAGFDLSAGVVTKTPTGGSAGIIPVGNGWYRCWSTYTTTSVTDYFSIYFSSLTGVSDITAAGTETFYVWGAQLEAGAFPTSYIPTTSAAVTRSADRGIMSGTNFTSWYRQDEGTWYAETQRIGTPQTADEGAGIEISGGVFQTSLLHLLYDGGSFNRPLLAIFPLQGGNLSITGGVAANFTYGEAPRKFAVAVKSGDSGLSSNGSVVTTNTAQIALPIARQLDFRSNALGGQGSDFNGYIRKFAFYSERLTNTELQALST